jgi:hypothetical protein
MVECRHYIREIVTKILGVNSIKITKQKAAQKEEKDKHNEDYNRLVHVIGLHFYARALSPVQTRTQVNASLNLRLV